MERTLSAEETLVDSFTVFVKEVEPKLKVALCASFGREVGLEAAAHAFEYGWKNWSKVRAMESPAGYLWQVGRNRARRLARGKPHLFQAVRIDRLPWVEPGLPKALAALSEKQRVSVILVYGMDWTFEETSQLLGVSRSTVQKHVDRAMKRLRRDLGVSDD